ncbi:MAG: hypothetical protein JWP28_639 [Phenylobacterium sp.]|uniref:hypothetical protein n=1 Tax=Phenylobacterium sp. TaxID=1871053 RepID=UPI002604EB5D|nr:hypothetical protein [Phenylobacterium sp.]MDB5464969.1 hypothetical protein [Phenylobacterium sp.]MDB5496608.1 hypothetical protein [Phenylobacterium sp.]
MPKTLSYAALAAALAIAGPVLAQATSPGAARQAVPQTAAPPPATSTAPSATTSSSALPPASSATSPSATTSSGTNAAANVGASAEVSSGMSVKDNTGAAIGQVTEVKNGVATIKMGADTFAVDTSKLGVQNGAATINASQADIRKMLPKK